MTINNAKNGLSRPGALMIASGFLVSLILGIMRASNIHKARGTVDG